MAKREIAGSVTNLDVPSETVDRVLAQADDVIQGKANADWRADWTYEWANTLLALAERVKVAERNDHFLIAQKTDQRRQEAESSLERHKVTLQLIDDACRNTPLDTPVGLLTADIRAHILALARVEMG
jgi:hypothetical protein